MTPQERAEFDVLHRMTHSQRAKSGKEDHYMTLYGERLRCDEIDHQILCDRVMAEMAVQDAVTFPYGTIRDELEKAVKRLPDDVTLQGLAQHMIWVQSWKDYVGEIRRVVSYHCHTMDSACARISADWQSRSLAFSEWAAKQEAQARHEEAQAIRATAKNMRRQCQHVFERLEGQWMTVSRVASVLDSIIKIGEVPVIPLGRRDYADSDDPSAS